jgi:transketolase
LGKLIYLYDNNRISLAGAADLSFTEDCAKRFEAYGWHTLSVENGNDLEAIHGAIRAAREEQSRPSLILLRTHIGFGSPGKQDTFEAHGSPLGEAEVKRTKEKLGWPLDPPFYIPKEAETHFRAAISTGQKAEASWQEHFNAYREKFSDLAREFQQIMSGALPANWQASIPSFPADPKGLATRAASGKIIAALATALPTLIGGSADLNPSTFTVLPKLGDFESPQRKFTDNQGSAGGDWNYAGRNIHFGVREHAMGATINGMAAHGGLIPFGSTFLIFSDYMRPSMRLAALMELGVIYVFTHDSIGLGEDGPTHQPVEQLAALRAIPRLIVIRPGDANETSVAWQIAIESRSCPVALVLSRQNVPTLERSQYASADGLRRGAYVLADAPGGRADIILIGTGSELSLVVAARERLAKQNIHARVVSMPSWELFDQQPKEYRATILPKSVPARLAVEAALPLGWHRYVGDNGDVVGIERFGASAPGNVVMEKLGFTVDHVVERATALLGK